MSDGGGGVSGRDGWVSDGGCGVSGRDGMVSDGCCGVSGRDGRVSDGGPTAPKTLSTLVMVYQKDLTTLCLFQIVLIDLR